MLIRIRVETHQMIFNNHLECIFLTYLHDLGSQIINHTCKSVVNLTFFFLVYYSLDALLSLIH